MSRLDCVCFLALCGALGACFAYMIKPVPAPTLTQSQLDHAVYMLDRHGNKTEENSLKMKKIEQQLLKLEQRMNATLPDPMRMK